MRVFRVCAALLAPWLVLEILLRVTGYQPPDLRPRMALFPRFPAFYEPDRDLGWRLKPDLRWTGMELATPFRTNAEGHRTHGALAPGGRVVVDCLGDSSTFGFGSADEATYPAVLERRLNDRRGTTGAPMSVRNLGVPGYTSSEARLIAASGDVRAPVTLVMVGFNDHFPATRPRAASLRARRLAYGCFASRGCSLLFDWATRRDPDAPRPAPPAPTEFLPDVAPDEFSAALDATVASIRANGSTPVLLVYPSLDVDEKTIQEISSFWKHPIDLVRANVAAHTDYQRLTREAAVRSSAHLVDLAPIFDRRGNHALHFDWVHPNAAGLALIADTVAPVVEGLIAP